MVGRGTFSESTTLDLVRMDLDGRLGGLLPDGISVLLLTTPVAALVLVALAPWAVVAPGGRGVPSW
ncbi:hypothetical protein [Nocardioides yefusunii]|uniref:hypothetical protein n=1 Tax=Nocardioides yefusunii TaxID=2500546 RepID=UPI000FE38864|nr:hypothetical protein [Nocardioides yefusunii]